MAVLVAGVGAPITRDSRTLVASLAAAMRFRSWGLADSHFEQSWLLWGHAAARCIAVLKFALPAVSRT